MIVESVTGVDDGVVLATTSGRLLVQAISSRVMRVVFTTRNSFTGRKSPSVLLQRPFAPLIESSVSRLRLSAGELLVDVDRRSGAFTWRGADGQLLFREPQDGRDGKTLEEIDVVVTRFDDGIRHSEVQSVDGVRAVVEGGRTVVDRQAYRTRMRLQFQPDEAIYGLGQHEDGIFNYRGHAQELYQQNMKIAVPVLLSTRGYAVVWNSHSAADFRDGADGAEFITDTDDQLDFYVIVGPEFDAIIGEIRSLTGRVPMLPRWTLGYLQSKEHYASQRELLDVVAEFRRRHIPLDCIVQDWKSWPEGLWGQKSFDVERYPDPDQLSADLHAERVRLMVSIWPNMLNDGPNQRELRAAGLLLGNDSTYDARQSEARERYWGQVDEGYFRHGVDAWWTDCTEPFEADWKGAVKPDSAARRTMNVGEAKRYLDPAEVTTYSLLHTQGIYEGQRASDNSKRVVVLTRSASLGQQRYGAVSWSGDICATWQTLRNQLADGLNFCLTGNPRWTFDIGAFFVGRDEDYWFWNGDFPAGVADAGYRELYLRWLQVATFLPMMRSHGTETPREPWRFGEPGHQVYDAIIDFIGLRYRLLPYLYTLMAQETRDDYTSFRALVFDFRADPATHNISDQFMLGPALMICPVTRPMFFGPGSALLADQAQTRSVYLPHTADWYDFWTGQRHRGGQTVEADAPLSRIPVFVRAGSILPLGPLVEHSGASAAGPLEVRVYPGEDCRFEFYEDAGDGYGYEHGEILATRLSWDEAGRTLTAAESVGNFRRPAKVDAQAVLVGAAQGCSTWEWGTAHTVRAPER